MSTGANWLLNSATLVDYGGGSQTLAPDSHALIAALQNGDFHDGPSPMASSRPGDASEGDERAVHRRRLLRHQRRSSRPTSRERQRMLYCRPWKMAKRATSRPAPASSPATRSLARSIWARWAASMSLANSTP